MIDKSKITLEWIEQLSKNNRNADKILIDRVIHSLLLAEGLIKQNLNFVFKGGTALMLLFNSGKRFSIDIDIVLPGRPDNLNKIFGDLLEVQGFSGFLPQERTSDSNINKEHFKFFYTPVYKTKTEQEYVLLDILYENSNYIKIHKIPLQSSFIPQTGQPLEISIPSFEDMLGDKLTAFAPVTTGIPYFKKDISMSMEIIKQLYDIGNLFDVVTDLNIIKSVFSKFIKTELSYRNKNNLTRNDVLDDIYHTSLCLVSRGTDGKGNFEQLKSGIQRVKQFIFSENYQIEKAIVHASKTAYLSLLIKYNETQLNKFTDISQLMNLEIKPPSNTKLNRLKKSNPEAFFYWYKIYELTINH